MVKEIDMWLEIYFLSILITLPSYIIITKKRMDLTVGDLIGMSISSAIPLFNIWVLIMLLWEIYELGDITYKVVIKKDD